jgi:hypothetical protein
MEVNISEYQALSQPEKNQYWKQLQLDRLARTPSERDAESIEELLKAGFAFTAIASAIDLNLATVKSVAKARGLKKATKQEIAALESKNRADEWLAGVL